MRTLKLTLAYDGGDFIGWQRQPIGQSIQGELERAFKEIEELNSLIGEKTIDSKK